MALVTQPLRRPLDPDSAVARLRAPGRPTVFLDGRGEHDGAWGCRAAIAPRTLLALRGGRQAPDATLGLLDATIARRRSRGGPGGTGIALLAAYELFAGVDARRDTPWDLIGFEVDASITFEVGGTATLRGEQDRVERAQVLLAGVAGERIPTSRIPIGGAPRTSLPKAAYCRAVGAIRDHIARGDIYQGNLTQTFRASWRGDPWEAYRALAAATPAPRSAYVDDGRFALASVSPEVFVDVDASGRAQTRPIKGTRPRGADAASDAAAARELLASMKDRAELVMIVDLERNDLGRISRTGSVRVPELCALRSYPAVHHLVARVESQLKEGIRPSDLLRAVFPGGSITGAPKERAMAILAAQEPVPRGLYTGSLFWLDDDGSTASSILIRSAVMTDGRVRIGAGGGVVTDSDPESEWMESNAKARALTRVFGFEPEEAG